MSLSEGTVAVGGYIVVVLHVPVRVLHVLDPSRSTSMILMRLGLLVSDDVVRVSSEGTVAADLWVIHDCGEMGCLHRSRSSGAAQVPLPAP